MDMAGPTIEEQTTQALHNVKTVLEAAGSSIDKVVKITILLIRPDLAKGMNEAYAKFFSGAKPTRAIARQRAEGEIAPRGC